MCYLLLDCVYSDWVLEKCNPFYSGLFSLLNFLWWAESGNLRTSRKVSHPCVMQRLVAVPSGAGLLARTTENAVLLQDTTATQKGHPTRCPFCVSNLKF